MGFHFFRMMPMGLRLAAFRAAGAPLLIYFIKLPVKNQMTASARKPAGVNISSQVKITNLLKSTQTLLYDRNIIGPSSEMYGNVRLGFGTILENPRKSSESGRKSSENRHKRRY